MAASAKSAGPARGRSRRGSGTSPSFAPRAAAAPGGVAVPGAAPAIRIADPKASRDPRLTKVLDKLQQGANKLRRHPPAANKSAEAQAAAQPPANEKLAGAHGAQVDSMKSAEGEKPQPSSFLETLRAEITKVMPKTLGDTDKFMDSDQKAQMKGAMTGNVNQQKDAATSDMKSATNAPPDTSKVEGKSVVPLPAEGAPQTPDRPGAKDAMPAPKPDSEVSLQASKVEAADTLKQNQLTPEQLQKANDPRFSNVLKAKQDIEKQADTAPNKYRGTEQKTLSTAAAASVAQEGKNLQAMQGVAGKSADNVKARQLTAKQKDEIERKKVTDTIEGIFARTKQSVEDKLAALETDVSAMFDKGVEVAISNMKAYVNKRLDDYKSARYRGLNFWKWAKDKLFDLPKEVDVFYEDGRKLFTKELDSLIVAVANLVEQRLKEAKDIIAAGQKEISSYVNGLPKDLQAVGRAAEKDVAGRFDELRQGVEDKKNDLAQKLAQQYKDAREKADAALKEIQEENKGLATKLKEYVGEVIEVLRNFKNRILGMLKKAKDAIDLIVADPIGFLKNLLSAIKKGLSQFVDNIWTHLKAGFLGWLFGALGDAGITIPSDFSLGSILKLVLQVMGLTYDRIRAKAVKLIGERNVQLIEKAWELLYVLLTGGPSALWEKIKEFIGDLKAMVMNAIQEWVVSSIIKAAVTKLATMFNPVGAIIQAIITIYNTVMFLIERINQILDFVEAVVSSVYKIAIGDIASAATWVENALARTIPIIISFLARLLGLSGISEKIKSIINKIRGTVDKAVDKLIAKVVGGIGKLFGKDKKKDGKPDGAPADKWDIAVAGVQAELQKMDEEGGATQDDIEKALPGWKQKYGFTSLTIATKADEFEVDGEMSPKKKVAAVPKNVGTQRNPFLLDWLKPPTSDYPTVYFGPKTTKAVPQDKITLMPKSERDKLVKCTPHKKTKLPGTTTEIGIGTDYRVPLKKNLIGPLPGSARTPGGGVLLDVLRPHGFRAADEGFAGDHIIEIQIGGPNILDNLWPLKASINSSAGSALSRALVKYPKGKKTVSVPDLKEKVKKTGAQYYFKLTKV